MDQKNTPVPCRNVVFLSSEIFVGQSNNDMDKKLEIVGPRASDRTWSGLGFGASRRPLKGKEKICPVLFLVFCRRELILKPK